MYGNQDGVASKSAKLCKKEAFWNHGCWYDKSRNRGIVITGESWYYITLYVNFSYCDLIQFHWVLQLRSTSFRSHGPFFIILIMNYFNSVKNSNFYSVRKSFNNIPFLSLNKDSKTLCISENFAIFYDKSFDRATSKN